MKFHGDSLRWYMGDVVDVSDPLQLGRVRVRIFGIHEGVPEDYNLPWAQVCIPVTEGGTAGSGSNLGLQIGARVFGFFMDGKNSQSPLVLGSVPKYETESGGGRSTDLRARGGDDGKSSITKTPTTEIGEPDDPYAAVYPNNSVHRTASGHILEFDDTSGAERILIYHKGGSFVEFHPNGDIVTQHKNGFRTVTGNDKCYVNGNFELIVEKDMKVTVKGNVIEDFQGNQTTSVSNDVVITTSDGKIHLN